MRKLMIPTLVASAMALGGCSTVLPAVLGTVLQGGLGGGGYGTADPYGSGYGSQNFQQAAVNACGSQASRYGQVRITNVQQVSSSTLRVYGAVSNGYQQRNFACSFRSDGRITDFDI